MDPESPSFTKEDSPQLQRGKACLSCRRRKMRCDGARPYCTQCIRGNRAEDCEYTDTQGRTRTQILEESVALLQARIDELESPGRDRQSVFLHDPYQQSYRHTTASEASRGQVAGSVPPVRPGSVPAVFSWWEAEEPPSEIRTMLVESFLPHAFSLGFALSPESIRQGLHLPTLHPSRTHSALLHVIFLWAVSRSQAPELIQQENIYLQRAVLALQDALTSRADQDDAAVSRQRVSAVQAEVLLARYFFNLGRLLEGRFHASAAVSLAISCGMHRNTIAIPPQTSSSLGGLSSIGTPVASSSGAGLFDLAPARDFVELGERVRLFWEVFILDRCWSVALGSPCVLTDDTDVGTRIDTPLPLEMQEYEELTPGSAAAGDSTQGWTIQEVLSADSSSIQQYTQGSTLALRAVAAAFYERSARLATLHNTAAQQSQSLAPIQTEVQKLSRRITQFARGLRPLEQLNGAHSAELGIHALAHAAMINLYSTRISVDAGTVDPSSINAALMHATEIVKALEKILNVGAEETGSVPVDPILSSVGSAAAEVFAGELRRMQQLPQEQTSGRAAQTRMRALQSNMQRVLETLHRASLDSPVFAQQARRIQDFLDS